MTHWTGDSELFVSSLLQKSDLLEVGNTYIKYSTYSSNIIKPINIFIIWQKQNNKKQRS